jgi:hypothetical protein
MGLLAETYPEAQFVVTGAAGKDSNAHVPDEWLNVDQATRVTEAVALILDAHAGQHVQPAGQGMSQTDHRDEVSPNQRNLRGP